MRKEAIKNENYLSLRQLRTIAPGFRLHCVVLRPRIPVAPLGSQQPPPSCGLGEGPAAVPTECPHSRSSGLSTHGPACLGARGGSFTCRPFLACPGPTHPEVEIKSEEATGRALGWPPEMP